MLLEEFVCNASVTKCCTMNCCQHFPCEKTLLLKQEFWNLSFEDRKTYGLDIPRRLHTRKNGRQQKFITIQSLDICETTWYQNIGFSRSIPCYTNQITSEVVSFYHMGTKVHINYVCQFDKNSLMFNHWSIFLDTMPHQMKRIGNGRQDAWHILFETWKSLQERSDQVNCMEWPTLFVSI
jgi:hypothetical protein